VSINAILLSLGLFYPCEVEVTYSWLKCEGDVRIMGHVLKLNPAHLPIGLRIKYREA